MSFELGMDVDLDGGWSWYLGSLAPRRLDHVCGGFVMGLEGSVAGGVSG